LFCKPPLNYLVLIFLQVFLSSFSPHNHCSSSTPTQPC
jgi:hypothetical protein